ncbi:MAG: UDP-3-O-acyl-N-acetylglucosamine deacetylase [Kiritimatiellia bacterium]|jgi:UDP-3-O-acyl-N-acetylglucosamine deacetylase
MGDEPFGLVLHGTTDEIRASYKKWESQPVDMDLTDAVPDSPEPCQTTIAQEQSVSGPGTFFGKEQRTLVFAPSARPGWWFDRRDLPGSLPIRVSVHNVWTTARNIVLRSGSPHNYMRMVEHIIALRVGMQIDNLVIRVDSGDPPLFDRGSMDLVEALETAGKVVSTTPAVWLTPAEPVTVGGPNGSFLTLLPTDVPALHVDCATDFPNAIGKQRLRFTLNRQVFRQGALARTNTTAAMRLYCLTIGKLFADIRNLGYTNSNILIAGKRRYLNEPKLLHEGKSLEAVWHRSMLDLLAALALIEDGRLAARVISYKSGHSLDVEMMRVLFKYNLLRPLA